MDNINAHTNAVIKAGTTKREFVDALGVAGMVNAGAGPVLQDDAHALRGELIVQDCARAGTAEKSTTVCARAVNGAVKATARTIAVRGFMQLQ